MRHQRWLWSWIVWGALLSSAAQAQIVPDQTLGTERSRLTPALLNGGVSDRIDGGAIRGINLFHSFLEFNIKDGQRLYFANPTGIQNILTRITGKNLSNIDGILGVEGSANLFLMNPNGIIFGQNARLDINGSFIGTTANAIGFGDRGVFSASTPETPALLTVNPAALLFSQIQGGEISSRDANLVVPNGQSLLLVGGDVKLEGGFVATQGGRIELGGLSAPGSINLSQTGQDWSLAFPDRVERSRVSIVNSSAFVSGSGSSGIAITAKAFSMSGSIGGQVATSILDGEGAVNTRAGNITIDATDSVTLSQPNFVSSAVYDGIGDGGNIVIKTGTLLVKDGFVINTFHAGQGNGGDILITARDTVMFSGISDNSRSSANTFVISGSGNAGSIQVTTGSLFLKEGGLLSTSSDRPGNSGNVTVNARDTVVIDGGGTVLLEGFEGVKLSSSIATQLGFNGIGKGGNIQINTGTFRATNGGSLGSQTLGRGNAGNISINARDSVVFSGSLKDSITIKSSEARSDVLSGIGNGGNIEITTNSLVLTAGGSLNAGTSGQGDGGNILITARDSVKVDGGSQDTQILRGKEVNSRSNINSDVLVNLFDPSGKSGNGGEIRIDTGALSITNGAYLTSDTSGQGNSGNITINARDRIFVDGAGKLVGNSLIGSQVLGGVFPDGVPYRGTGQGGNLNLTTKQVIVSNGGSISSATAGDGNAGNVLLSAQNSITISGVSPLNGQNSGIFASTSPESIGRGGELQVRTGVLSLLAKGVLSSDNRGAGNAGSVDVQANSIQLKDGSEIRTLTTSGNGGNIFLAANNILLMRRGSTISASAIATSLRENLGNGGNITINTTGIVAPLRENNTIAANATKGNGGNVVINTQGLYGIETRSQAIPGLSSITATSDQGVQGQITLIQPQIQPVQGTIELPTTPIPGNQIAQTCPRGNPDRPLGSFVVSGRGSAPSSPIQPLSGRASIPLARAERSASTATVPIERSPEIIEAQEWIKTRDGKVMLVARSTQTGISTGLCPQK